MSTTALEPGSCCRRSYQRGGGGSNAPTAVGDALTVQLAGGSCAVQQAEQGERRAQLAERHVRGCLRGARAG